MRKQIVLFFFLISLFALSPLSAQVEPLSLAIWQLEIDDELVFDREAYREAIEQISGRAAAAGADLLLVPEYANVMSALSEYSELIESSKDMEDALNRLGRSMGRELRMKSIFRSHSRELRAWMDEVWGRAARENGICILAGTYFAAEGDRLFNRAVLYNRGGQAVYEQDKLRLTPFERDLLELDPGSPYAAELITLQGRTIGFSICRDTFFSDYAGMMKEADLWIDLKANGEHFVGDTRHLFDRALPARQLEYEIPWGVTVCLNGSFLDLFWEGPSEAVRLSRGEQRLLWRSKKIKDGDFQVLSLP